MAAPPPAAGRRPRAGELELLDEARRVAANAYAPYSGFGVGAVAVAGDGRRFAGVNVENASYPVGQCAERVALGALASAGERRVDLVAVAAASGADLLPCGACLQALAEFGEPDRGGSARGTAAGLRAARAADRTVRPADSLHGAPGGPEAGAEPRGEEAP